MLNKPQNSPPSRKGRKAVKKAPETNLGRRYALTPSKIRRRLQYFEITPQDIVNIREIHRIIDPRIEEIVDAFYQHIEGFSPLTDIINAHSSVTNLKRTFRSFILGMGIDLDTQAYIESRLRVGAIHSQIELKPHWYLGAYSQLQSVLSRILDNECGNDHRRWRLNDTLMKIMMFEASLGIDAYHLGTVSNLNESLEKIKKTEKTLKQIARTDGLTGILNRKTILHELQKELDRSHRYGHSLAVLFIDFDHFKLVNDTHGHQFGDHVLKQATKTIRDTIRNPDIFGRYGGEEFIVVLTECGPEDAYNTAERIRRNISGHIIQKRRTGVFVPITVSIGIHIPTPKQRKAATVLRYADRALYASKKAGRNRTTVYSPKMES